MGGWRGLTAVAAVILLGPVPVSLLAFPARATTTSAAQAPGQGIFSQLPV